MSKFYRALVTIEFAVCFGFPFFLWIWGMFIVLSGHSFPGALFALGSVGFIKLPIYFIPAMFGAVGAWGVFVLYLNAAFGYKAFSDLKNPIACGVLGVCSLLFVAVIFNPFLVELFRPFYSPLVFILPLGCFAHLVWLNKMVLVSNGT